MGEELQRELAYYKRQLDEVAGENLKLDYMISGLRHEVRQKREGFALLSELQQSIGAHPQISSIYEITVSAISSTLGMDRTLVLSPADEEHRYRPAHWLGFREEAAAELPRRIVELPADFARGADALVVNKATETTPAIERIRAAFDLPFFVAVPVMSEVGPIGILLTGRLKEVKPLYPPFDQGDVDTLQAIAGLISASIRNMRVAVLEETDRLKTEFFANISHEFRTPITLTLGPLEQVLAGRHGEVAEEARERLRVIQRSQERLLSLVNQILDLSKLEAGGTRIRASRISDVNRYVRGRVAQLESAAEERGLELRLALDPAVAGAEVYLDRERFDRLLLNLVSNALKFTRHGWIEVATAIKEGRFRLSVTDTGVGIKEDQLPYIFDRFRQADGSEAREYAGTGIGLALVHEIARLHGGEVTAYSEYGRGSSFRVTIPLGSAHLEPSTMVEAVVAEDEPAEAAGREPVAVDAEGRADRQGVERLNAETRAAFDPDRPTVLYAEDNADLRRHVRDLLAPDYNVFLAVDGRDGYERAREVRPDVVLTDQMMPNMSGKDLLGAIRRDADLASTPVIFLTARAGTEARIESLEAGADDYLTKPFHEGEIRARVSNLVRAREQERALAELAGRLEARVEEQMGELIRTGELRRFLPQSVARSILEGEIAPAEHFERRKITVLFVDMVGFTDLTDVLEPEELSAIANEFLREMIAIAIERGGTVDKMMGDGLMVLFGAPEPAEPAETAVAAVRTAMTMRDAMGELRTGWRRRGVSGEVAVRVGINTGFCTVGVFGSEYLRSYTAVGSPVNIAARLQVEAEPGHVLCGLPTYALVEGGVEAEPLGPLALRGVARPVEAYEIRALVPAPDAAAG